jgi:diaminopimelate decarboxylase
MNSWDEVAGQAVALVGTPCYLMSAADVRSALDELRCHTGAIRARHLLSMKTQPVRPLLELWRDWNLGVEVVSPFELHAALQIGLPPEAIVVNGTGKHRWLDRNVDGLTVHFDSLNEVSALADTATARRWRVGLRCHIPPADGHERDQFGMTRNEIAAALRQLTYVGIHVSGIHFHLHTNVAHVAEFASAVAEVRQACTDSGFEPEYVDIGGGLPVAGEVPLGVKPSQWRPLDLDAWSQWLATIPEIFPRAREVWLENGRFLTARAGVLILTVVDRKERGDEVFVICDGGRTNHARMSAIESHIVRPLRDRGGEPRRTVVCGPTCGAVDRLGTFALPESLRVGDRLLWMNAGAYAIPLETRFSFGLAPLVWADLDGHLSVCRPRETAEEWWNQWRSS